jgi:endoglycosylceramidase
VAGTPERFGFERGAATFNLSYSGRLPGDGTPAADAETEVFLPKCHYPRGYRVEITGGAAVSDPGAEILRLAAAESTERVELCVHPV